MIRKLEFCFCFLFLNIFFLAIPQNCVAQDSLSLSNCRAKMDFYKKQWLNDSLAKNGFKEYFAFKILRKCSLEGERWNAVSDFFGKPNYNYFHSNGEHIFRYRLTHFNEDYKAIGEGLLDIGIKNGIITSFGMWHND